MSLTAKIDRAHTLIRDALRNRPAHPRLMSSFGKDSLVMTDLLAQHGVRDVLYLEDVDEVVDPGHIQRTTDRYRLRVTRLEKGRGFFFLHGTQPMFLALVFVNEQHATPVPTNIVPYEGTEGTFTCMDECLRATRGRAVPVPTDYIFSGFKLSDVSSKGCLTYINLLSARAADEKLRTIRLRGPFFNVAPGLPSCAPLLEWEDDDVWQYLRARNIPTSDLVYDEEGRRRPTAMTWCYRCHDPHLPSLVHCPKVEGQVLNVAATVDESGATLRQLQALGVMQADDLTDLGVAHG